MLCASECLCVLSGDTLTHVAAVCLGSVPGFQSITETLEGGEWVQHHHLRHHHQSLCVWQLGFSPNPRRGLLLGATSHLIHDQAVLIEAAAGLLDGAGLSLRTGMNLGINGKKKKKSRVTLCCLTLKIWEPSPFLLSRWLWICPLFERPVFDTSLRWGFTETTTSTFRSWCIVVYTTERGDKQSVYLCVPCCDNCGHFVRWIYLSHASSEAHNATLP